MFIEEKQFHTEWYMSIYYNSIIIFSILKQINDDLINYL